MQHWGRGGRGGGVPEALRAPPLAHKLKHTHPYKTLHIAFLPVIADTVGYLHEHAVRLLYRAATVKAAGNLDNEGLIGRGSSLRHPKGEYLPALPGRTGLLLAALGAQQRRHPNFPKHFFLAIPSSRRS